MREAARTVKLHERGFVSEGAEEKSRFEAQARRAACDGAKADVAQAKARVNVTQVEQSRTDVILSWPASALDYPLVSVASLTDTNWLAVTNPPVLTGLRQQVTNTINSGSRFYRLRKL